MTVTSGQLGSAGLALPENQSAPATIFLIGAEQMQKQPGNTIISVSPGYLFFQRVHASLAPT